MQPFCLLAEADKQTKDMEEEEKFSYLNHQKLENYESARVFLAGETFAIFTIETT